MTVKKEFVACPLCGMNRIAETKRPFRKGGTRITWDRVDLASYLILQVREGGGKKPRPTGKRGRGRAPGSGFHLIEEESLTLREMMESGDYAQVLEGLKAQLIRIIRDGIEIGFLKRDEI